MTEKQTPEKMFIDSLETFIAMQEVDEVGLYWQDDFGNWTCADEDREWELQKEKAIKETTQLIKNLQEK